jgi:protocatechuate 3,4-dioxygenase beta subunit
LTKGAVVKGRVLNDSGAPVRAASVNWGELTIWPNSGDRFLGQRTVTTDAQGRFQLDHAPLKHLYFLVQATNCAPAAAELDPEPAGSEIELRLAPPTILTGAVLDTEGKPVAGATVSFTDYGNWRGLHWETNTDDKGAFQWAGSPAEKFRLELAKDGRWGQTVETPSLQALT